MNDVHIPRLASRVARAMLALALGAACAESTPPAADIATEPGDTGIPDVSARRGWQIVATPDAAVLGAWSGPGTSRLGEVWLVGADVSDGRGPLVMRGTSVGWSRIALADADPQGGHLWAVAGSGASGPVWLAGDDGRLLRVRRIGPEGVLVDALASGTDATLFGLWAVSETELWAVGGYVYPRSGPPVMLHVQGDRSELQVLPEGADGGLREPLFAVAGAAPDDVWAVGGAGLVLHWDGSSWTASKVGDGTRLASVAVTEDLVAIAGGTRRATLFERGADGVFADRLEGESTILSAVALASDQRGIAAGINGVLLGRSDGTWSPLPPPSRTVDWAAATIDVRGDAWVVGGDLTSGGRLIGGLVARYGPARGDVPSF